MIETHKLQGAAKKYPPKISFAIFSAIARNFKPKFTEVFSHPILTAYNYFYIISI